MAKLKMLQACNGREEFHSFSYMYNLKYLCEISYKISKLKALIFKIRTFLKIAFWKWSRFVIYNLSIFLIMSYEICFKTLNYIYLMYQSIRKYSNLYLIQLRFQKVYCMFYDIIPNICYQSISTFNKFQTYFIL
jgi:hypothetical protein